MKWRNNYLKVPYVLAISDLNNILQYNILSLSIVRLYPRIEMLKLLKILKIPWLIDFYIHNQIFQKDKLIIN